MLREDDEFSDYSEKRSRRRFRLGMAACLCLVIAVIVIPVSLTAGKEGSSSRASGIGGGTMTEEMSSLQDMLEAAYEHLDLDTSVLSDPDSPQFAAMEWLSTDPGLENYDRTQRVQRYVLATFYYATNRIESMHVPTPGPWKSNFGWLSDAHECDWEGIICSTRLRVTGIALEENDLSGALPMELGLIREHFESLDLTSNDIFMQGPTLDVFAHLTSLRTLLMDDNYLTTNTGMPESLRSLSNLEKIRLSYNILSGEVDPTFFENMHQLTHLEVESNFLSGGFPTSLNELTNLVYLYIRRNEFSFNLDFMKTQNMRNLFALWLDDNDITGTIPTEIGEFAEMASLSITNATLHGTIPTEIATLHKLRRLWLYSNDLRGQVPVELGDLDRLEVFEIHGNPRITGEMPQGVCDSVEAATYRDKALTSDCDSNDDFSCDCCTRCY